MRARGILLGWAVVTIVLLLLFGYALAEWRALSAEAQRAASDRARLSGEIRLRDQQLVAEMRAHAALLHDMQWTAEGGDSSAFLGRLAELAREQHVTVLSIGPLERHATPQYTKSWHTIQIAAPYREIRDLAARVERDRGILEEVRLEPAPLAPGRPSPPGVPGDVQARFRLVALELSPQARKVLDRAVAASGGAVTGASAGGAVPSATTAADAPLSRDPFAFAPTPKAVAARTLPPAAPPPPPPPSASPPRPPAALELSAIMSAAGGSLAIVNNQVVRVGDEIAGHRVEEITATSVVVREPGEPPRTLELPDVAGAAPAPRR